MTDDTNCNEESTPPPRRAAGEATGHSRRDLIRAAGASLALGSLAGCPRGASDTAFRASPVAFSGGWDGSDWLAVDRPTLGDVDVVVLPTAGAKVTATEQLDPAGEVSVTSHGTTHPILGVTGDGSHFLDGELVAVTSPVVDLPGRDDQNPLADIGVGDLVGTLGSVTTRAADFGNPHDVVAERSFDGTLPSGEELLAGAYRGILREVELTTPVETTTGWFDPNSPPCGTAGAEVRGVAPDPDGEPVSLFGMKQEVDGNHVIQLAWVRQFHSPADEQPPSLDALDRFNRLASHLGSGSCSVAGGWTDVDDPDGDCRGTGRRVAVTQGRKVLLGEAVAMLESLSDNFDSEVARTRELLDQASAEARGGAAEAAVSDARSAVNRIETLNGEIDDRLSGLPEFDSGQDLARLRTAWVEEGIPTLKAVGERAERIQEAARGARESMAAAGGAGDVIGDVQTKLATFDDLGQAFVEVSCNVETGQDSVYVR